MMANATALPESMLALAPPVPLRVAPGRNRRDGGRLHPTPALLWRAHDYLAFHRSLVKMTGLVSMHEHAPLSLVLIRYGGD